MHKLCFKKFTSSRKTCSVLRIRKDLNLHSSRSRSEGGILSVFDIKKVKWTYDINLVFISEIELPTIYLPWWAISDYIWRSIQQWHQSWIIFHSPQWHLPQHLSSLYTVPPDQCWCLQWETGWHHKPVQDTMSNVWMTPPCGPQISSHTSS